MEAVWKEDTVTFTGGIRRSGNSFVVTVPIELARRFLVEEGQIVKIIGMTRQTYNLEGMISMNLGVFKVIERVPVLELTLRYGVVENPEDVSEMIDGLLARYIPTSKTYQQEVPGQFSAIIRFGCIGDTLIRPKTGGEVKEIAEKVEKELESLGVEVVGWQIREEEITWHEVDPSVIARSPYMKSNRIKWTWEI